MIQDIIIIIIIEFIVRLLGLQCEYLHYIVNKTKISE